jgi:hypothetical protein
MLPQCMIETRWPLRLRERSVAVAFRKGPVNVSLMKMVGQHPVAVEHPEGQA